MDICELLERRFRDSFVRRGNEVSFNCYKCGEKRGHFYFNVVSGVGHCFLCGYKVNTFKLLKDLAFRGKVEPFKVKRFEEVITAKVRLPFEFKRFQYGEKVPVEFLEYIGKRKVSFKDLIDKGCGYCSTGFYNGRIVLPAYEDGVLKSFVARDITGRARLKYLYPKFGKISELLYNLEGARKYRKCVLVEGVFDCFRVGDLGVALFGKSLSKVQEEKLFLAGLKSVCVMLDSDAVEEAWEVAKRVSRFVSEVKVVELPNGDPCDFSFKQLEGFISGAKKYNLKNLVSQGFGKGR